jgi:hypothetical protein
MTASELVALAQQAGVTLEINKQGGLRVSGKTAEEFISRYREHLIREKTAILALLRGETPLADEDIPRQARMEFALAFHTRLEMEAERNVPGWLEWAFWCLFNDAMEGFVRWGLGEQWPQVQEAAQERSQAVALRERALERWASAHRERERHRYSARWDALDDEWRKKRDELHIECETWAWRAYLVEVALRNPEDNDQRQLDFWVDLSPWALWLAKNGRTWGLVWSDREAA